MAWGEQHKDRWGFATTIISWTGNDDPNIFQQADPETKTFIRYDLKHNLGWLLHQTGPATMNRGLCCYCLFVCCCFLMRDETWNNNPRNLCPQARPETTTQTLLNSQDLKQRPKHFKTVRISNNNPNTSKQSGSQTITQTLQNSQDLKQRPKHFPTVRTSNNDPNTSQQSGPQTMTEILPNSQDLKQRPKHFPTVRTSNNDPNTSQQSGSQTIIQTFPNSQDLEQWP